MSFVLVEYCLSASSTSLSLNGICEMVSSAACFPHNSFTNFGDNNAVAHILVFH